MVLFIGKCIFVVLFVIQLRKLIGIADIDTYLCNNKNKVNRNIRENDVIYVCKVYLRKLLLFYIIIESLVIVLFGINSVNEVAAICMVVNTMILISNNERFWWIKKTYSKQLVHLITESTVYISLLIASDLLIFLIYSVLIKTEKSRVAVFLGTMIIINVNAIRVLNRKHTIIMKIIRCNDHIKVSLKNGESVNADLINTFLSCTDDYLVIREFGNHTSYYKKDDILKITIGESKDCKNQLFKATKQL